MYALGVSPWLLPRRGELRASGSRENSRKADHGTEVQHRAGAGCAFHFGSRVEGTGLMDEMHRVREKRNLL